MKNIIMGFLILNGITFLSATAHAGKISVKGEPSKYLEITYTNGIVKYLASSGEKTVKGSIEPNSLAGYLHNNKKSYRKNTVIYSDYDGWYKASKYVLGLDRPYAITTEMVQDIGYNDFGLDDVIRIPITMGLETIILPISTTFTIFKNKSTNKDVKLILTAAESDEEFEVSHNRFLRILFHTGLIPQRH